MRRTFCLAIACAVSYTAFADEFWSHRFSVRTDVAYGDDPAQIADLYTQGGRRGPNAPVFAPADEARPILVWIHGGGWVAGDKATGFPNAIPYLERGWDVVNINYRQGPDTAPFAVDDAMCAYKWVVDQAKESGRTGPFVVSGASAGGHLALAVGLLNQTAEHACRADTPPSAVVNWFGITDIEAVEQFLSERGANGNYALSWIGDKAEVADISARYSPVHLVTDGAPPIITIHGTADTVVPYAQAQALHGKLKSRNRLVTQPDGGHGVFTDEQWQQAYTAVFEFLNETE